MFTEQQQIAQHCEMLFVDYARHVDFGEFDAFVELFSDDAILDLGFRIQGKEKIRRSMGKRSPELRSRHVLSNMSVDVDSATSASGIAYLTLYRHIGPQSLQDAPVLLRGPAAVGHYQNKFTLTTNGWRIQACQLHLAFQDPEQFPAAS